MKQTDRRSFLKITASSVGIGVLYSAYPAALSAVKREACFPHSAAPMEKSHLRSLSFNLAMHMSASMDRPTRSGPRHSSVRST